MSETLEAARHALLENVAPLLKNRPSVYSSKKIFHDPVWGTARLEPWEAALLDIPYFQRLRGLKQTGFAHLTYPSAEHSRFQHTLGVAHAAGKVFESLGDRLDQKGVTKRTSTALCARLEELLKDPRELALLRLTAMVHDLGHSFYSHTSERVFSLIPPFDALSKELTTPYAAKPPGAAEVAVYLLITSEEWQRTVTNAWKSARGAIDPPTVAEWEKIGRWVMGQEDRPEYQFLADMISGPLDADKLDYIARDAYAAGLPITYDLERFIATVAVDEQHGRLRLTIPTKGVNALEQIVMSRLMLNSYLYHHQKVRAAEVTLERFLLREYFDRGTVLGIDPPWPLFAMEDADVYGYAKQNPDTAVAKLVRRELPVRLAEFRRGTLKETDTESSEEAYTQLLSHQSTGSINTYKRLLEIETELSNRAGLKPGEIIVDVPRPPGYKDLEDLQIPNDATDSADNPMDMLNYHRWIDAYQAHRAYVRIFCPREHASSSSVWKGVSSWFDEQSLSLPESARRYK